VFLASSTFWFTGIVDSSFVLLYFIFAFYGRLKIRDLFLPQFATAHEKTADKPSQQSTTGSHHFSG